MVYLKKVFWGTFAQVIAKIVSISVGIFSVIFLTRYLGPTGYGQFNTALVFVGFLSVLGDLGVQSILVRELSQHPENKDKILGNVFVWRLFSAVLMIAIIIALSRIMPYDALVKLVIMIEAVRGAVYLFRSFFTGPLQWQMRLDLSAWGEILARVSYFIAVLSVVYFHFSLVVLFLLMFCCSSLELIFIYFCFKKIGGLIKWQVDFKFLKYFLAESIILGLAYILGNIHHQVDTVILSVVKPQHDVGIYGAAYHIFQNMVVFPGLFLAVIFPRFVEMAHKKKDWHRFFGFSLYLLWIAALPLALFVFFFAPYIIKVIGGDAFRQSVLPLQFLGFALIGAYIHAPFVQMAIALRKQKQVVLVTAIAVLINIVLNLILIPRYTYNGAAAATLISETCAFMTFLILFWNRLGFKINLFVWSKVLVPIVFIVCFWLFIKYLLPFSEFANQRLLIEFLGIVLIFLFSIGFYLILIFIFDLLPKKILQDIIK